MKHEFPKGFWWGAATSGPQTEGRFHKLHRNVFDYWYDTEPEAFWGGVGPDVTSNFYNDYVRDIALMKDFETGETDEEAVGFYRAMLEEFIRQGIRPIINLHHFDLPVELYEKYGGWESRQVVELFVIFARKCFALFGDLVKDWVTFNEPMVVAEGEYLYQFHYPNLVDGKKACQVIYNLNLASAKAIKAFRDSACGRQGGRIGNVFIL